MGTVDEYWEELERLSASLNDLDEVMEDTFRNGM